MDYVIADIHGCSKTLLALLNKLTVNVKQDTVYFLGDYVDRGPDSKGVLDIVMSLPNAVCHKGNHEDMMLKGLAGEEQWLNDWILNGGRETITSFPGYEVDEKYINFMNSLRLITELPKFYLAHAGIGHDAMNTPEEGLLWWRDCDVDLSKSGNRRLICGHTITPYKEIVESLTDNKIILDNGCVFTQYDGIYGRLLALRLDDMKLFKQVNIDI